MQKNMPTFTDEQKAWLSEQPGPIRRMLATGVYQATRGELAWDLLTEEQRTTVTEQLNGPA